MKEIIYTAIFIGLGILLVTLFLIMFRPEKESAETAADVLYTPGIYTASLVLGSQQVNVEVAVDAQKIHSISLTPLSDSVATMYPLMAPVMEDLEAQICKNQTTENLTYSNDSRYTSLALLNAIDTALSKAKRN